MKKIITILTAIFLFFLPWQTRLIILPGALNGGYSEYGTTSLYATEILLWLIVILLIADFFISKRILVATGRRERMKALAIFAALYLYSLFFHQNLVTLNYLRIFIEGFILFLIIRGAGETLKFAWFFTPTPKVNDSQTVEHHDSNLVADNKTSGCNLLVWGFIAGAAVQACLGIWQFFSQSAFASKWLGMAAHDPAILGTFVVETASGRWLRAYGALPHPNILAGYLVAAILVLLPLIRGGEEGLKKRLSYYFVLPILFAGLFFTFSRGAWIALVAGIIVVAVVSRRDAKFCVSTFIIPVSAVFLLLSILFWPLIATRTVVDGRLEIKSSSERIGYYGEAWTLIKKHPWTGVGLGNYAPAVHDEIDNARPAYAYQPVHNIFILALAELGVVGMLIIIASLFIFRKLIPWKKLVFLAPFLIIGLFDHYPWSLYPGIVLWAVYCGLTGASDWFMINPVHLAGGDEDGHVNR